jgi:CheY-like chemotaxis protein
MEELSEQQRTIVADVQRQLVDLQKQIEPLLKAQQMHPATEPLLMAEEKRPETVKWILWADDNPKNNAFLIEGLQDQGIDVVTALSTNEALAKFSGKKFDRVITDLGRQEDGRFNPMAGIELIRRIRSMDAHVPIFVYTNVRSASEQRRTALEAGANDITASPTDLLSMLQLSKS